MQVVVDGLMTSYELSGQGPVVVLLHGWGDRKETFRNVQSTLASDYQVVALDLPGFGQSQAPETVWRLDDYATFVAHFLKKLQLPKPKAIIGHSNGGALAIRGLARGTLQAEKLILLASSGIRTGQTLKRTVYKIIAKVGKVATFWLPERYRRVLRKKLYGVAGSDMLVAPHLKETFKLTVKQDVQTDATQLRLPTLLVYSRGDRAVPFADGQRLAQLIPASTFVEVAQADHFLHQTAEADVLKAIKGFL